MPFKGIKDRKGGGNCEEKYHPTRTRAGKLENKEFRRGIIGSVSAKARGWPTKFLAANFLAEGCELRCATLRSYRIYASGRKRPTLASQYFPVCELKLNPRPLSSLGGRWRWGGWFFPPPFFYTFSLLLVNFFIHEFIWRMNQLQSNFSSFEKISSLPHFDTNCVLHYMYTNVYVY